MANPPTLLVGVNAKLRLASPKVDQLVLACQPQELTASSVNLVGRRPSSKLSFNCVKDCTNDEASLARL